MVIYHLILQNSKTNVFVLLNYDGELIMKKIFKFEINHQIVDLSINNLLEGYTGTSLMLYRPLYTLMSFNLSTIEHEKL